MWGCHIIEASFGSETNNNSERRLVFKGDPNARPGGRADPLTNPEGLTSGWCSATVVAKFWFTLN
jgi:hypothetical protein